MTSHPTTPSQFFDDGQPITAGGPSGPGPTPEELADFERAISEARAKFIAAALAEDGMPISAGWFGLDAEPKALPPADRTESAHLDQIAPSG
jgi:hypothetical protein